jgi:hypothetical protein
VRYEHLRQGTSFAGVDGEAEEEDLLRGIEVAVLNGAGVDGLAGQVQVLLEASGFRVVGTGNAPSFGRETTTISYREDDPVAELAAVRLAELLEGAQLDPLTRDLTFEGATGRRAGDRGRGPHRWLTRVRTTNGGRVARP